MLKVSEVALFGTVSCTLHVDPSQLPSSGPPLLLSNESDMHTFPPPLAPQPPIGRCRWLWRSPAHFAASCLWLSLSPASQFVAADGAHASGDTRFSALHRASARPFWRLSLDFGLSLRIRADTAMPRATGGRRCLEAADASAAAVASWLAVSGALTRRRFLADGFCRVPGCTAGETSFLFRLGK